MLVINSKIEARLKHHGHFGFSSWLYPVAFCAAFLQQQLLVPQNCACLSQFPTPKVTTDCERTLSGATVAQLSKRQGEKETLISYITACWRHMQPYKERLLSATFLILRSICVKNDVATSFSVCQRWISKPASCVWVSLFSQRSLLNSQWPFF